MPAIVQCCPCKAVCPSCRGRCLDADGHTSCKTASQGFARLHQCRSHVWGTIGDFNEVCRSQRELNRKEFREEILSAHDQASRRMQKALGLIS